MTPFELGKNSAEASPPRRDGVPVGRFWLDFREKLMIHFLKKTAPIGSQFCKPNHLGAVCVAILFVQRFVWI